MYFAPTPDRSGGLPLMGPNFDSSQVGDAVLAQLFDPEFYDISQLAWGSLPTTVTAEKRTALSAAALICARPDEDTATPNAVVAPPENMTERDFLRRCLSVSQRLMPAEVAVPGGLWDKLYRSHTLVAAGITQLSRSSGTQSYLLHVPYVFRDMPRSNAGISPKESAVKLAAGVFGVHASSLLRHPSREGEQQEY